MVLKVGSLNQQNLYHKGNYWVSKGLTSNLPKVGIGVQKSVLTSPSGDSATAEVEALLP